MAQHNYRAVVDALLRDLNGQDLKAHVGHYTKDATHWDTTVPEATQPVTFEEVDKTLGAYLRAFPDLTMECTNVFGAGDFLVYEWAARGTHTAPLASPQGEVPPTGRRMEMRGCSVLRLNAEGLIAEEREYWDSGSFMQQLGLVPQP